MKLVFDDEFDTLSRYVDANGNVTCKPGGTGTWQTVFAFCSRTIASNYEQELYIDPAFITYLKRTVPTLTTVLPFSISNGILSIIASSSEPAILKAAGSWAKYTSGLLTSQYSFSQRYGYFEIRAKLPTGRGVWPAFWLLPTDKTWPPEIDILEAFGDTSSEGQGGRSDIHYAIHSQDKKYSCEGWYDTKTDVTAGFHTYGADVEPDGVTYYFDGAPYAHCPPDTEPHKPMYLLLNLAIGSAQSWPTAPDSSTVFPTSFLIDYVRAYQSSAR
jgi:beta-glucanase (GH16 family)